MPPQPPPVERHRQLAADPCASGVDAPISEQRDFWNAWNGIFIDHSRGQTSQRQAEVGLEWLARLGKKDLRLLDVGCGTGWLCAMLRRFGTVTGTDLSDEILDRARRKLPDVTFVAGDFMSTRFQEGGFDVITTLEVLAHVADQPAFLAKIARLLKPGGHLLLATQNRFVLERSTNVAPRAHGQIRRWVDAASLRVLLREQGFQIERLVSIFPYGDKGILRLVNSTKLNRLLSVIVAQERIDAWKERAGLGHTLMAWARRP